MPKKSEVDQEDLNIFDGKPNENKDLKEDQSFKNAELFLKAKRGKGSEPVPSSSVPSHIKNGYKKPGPKGISDDLDRALVIKGIKATIRTAKRLKNLPVAMKGYELLGKIEGSLDRQVKKVEHTGANGGPIEYSDKSESELRESIRHRLRGLREGAGNPLQN